MDVASPQSDEALSAGPEPAFHKRWSGWTVFWIFLVLVFTYVGVQTATTVALLFIKFPHVMAEVGHGDPFPFKVLVSQPTFLAQLLTPRGFVFIQLPTTAVMIAATLGLSRSALRASLEDLGFVGPPSGMTILIAVGAGLALWLASSLLGWAQERLSGPHPQQIELILRQHRGIASFAFDFLSAAILAPLWEETFFRGVFFTALVQRMPFWLAAVLSGLAFGLGHGDLWNLLPLWALGVGLAYVYYRTGNIWASMITHATINGFDTILIFFFPTIGN